MSKRVIVNVATGRYVKGQERLVSAFAHEYCVARWHDMMPDGCQTHAERPYAFKAYALHDAAAAGMDVLLWCDASIVPGPRPLEELWEKIEQDGIWFSNNGFSNYEWTADSAYPDLGVTREENRRIPHVVATAFGLDLRKPIGWNFLAEYYRLASETRTFCGPWKNTPLTPCGPADVRGHRHDQTAASVICWRLGVHLSDPPEWFAYRGGETEKTCLVADGAY